MEKPSFDGFEFMLKSCVKSIIFPKVKFLDKHVHGYFNQSANSVCGIVLSYCFKQVPQHDEANNFWRKAQPIVFKHLNVIRNNRIQEMKKIYIGKSLIPPKKKMHACNFLSNHTLVVQDLFKSVNDVADERQSYLISALLPDNLDSLLTMRKKHV